MQSGQPPLAGRRGRQTTSAVVRSYTGVRSRRRIGGHRLHLGQPLVCLRQVGFQIHDPALQIDHELLQVDDPAYALEAHAVVLAQSLDLAQQHDVPLAVAAAAARRPGRRHETQPVVLPQRLRVHSGQAGGHRDDQHLRVGGMINRRDHSFVSFRHGSTGSPAAAAAPAESRRRTRRAPCGPRPTRPSAPPRRR